MSPLRFNFARLAQEPGRRPNRRDQSTGVQPQNLPKPHGVFVPPAGLADALRTVVEALTAGGDAPTYPEAAASAGLPIGTLHDRLARVRRDHPDAYARLMAYRREQLAERHRRAQQRRDRRSKAWHRRTRAQFAGTGSANDLGET